MASQETRNQIGLIIFDAMLQYQEQVTAGLKKGQRVTKVEFDATPFVDRILAAVAKDQP